MKRNCFTYFLQWSDTGMKYYGVRWRKNCDPSDLWNTYFTSSNKVRKYLLEYGNPDIIKIRKVFGEDIEAAREWEHKVLKRLNVRNRQDYLNITEGKSIRYDVHPKGMLGKKHSPETLAKLKGRKCSDEAKKRMSEQRSGKNHWNYGRKWSEEAKEKNRLSNVQTWVKRKALQNTESTSDQAERIDSI